PRRFGRQPRPRQGRRADLRCEGSWSARVVLAPDIPRQSDAHPEPEDPDHPRLDARAVLPAGDCLAGELAAPARGVRTQRRRLTRRGMPDTPASSDTARLSRISPPDDVNRGVND